jgi:hypothetical protein
MFRCLLWAIAAAFRPRVLLIADNLCLRQTAAGPAAPQAATAPLGCGPTFRGSGVSLVR